MKYKMIVVAFVATTLLLSLASLAGAQNDPRWLGTSRSGFTAGVTKPQQLNIPITVQYSSASYGTGGVALRNRSKGNIHVSGVTAPTQAAWLYWAVLLNNPSTTQLKQVALVGIQREYPGFSTTIKVTGTLLAIGGDPCWGSTGAYVYRAAVPTSIVTGNGIYKITLGAGTGLGTGEDPWDGNVVFPLWEGASLVIIGTGSANVGIVDGQAGTTFVSSYSNIYQLPVTITGGNHVLFDNIGYDGQFGSSRTIFASNETTTVAGSPSGITVLVAGPGGETGDSDWDGSAGWPLPQLWDDTGHDISNAFAAGDTSVTVSYTSTGDCIGTVAAVLSVQ